MSARQLEWGGNDVVGYLRGRGIVIDPQLTLLTGGVSGETLLVEEAGTRVVVKRALAQLRVPGDWTAKPERAMTEAAAITLASSLTPDHAPRLIAADPTQNVIVMSAAPPDWVNWRSVLLGASADPTSGIEATAAELGAVLAVWHDRTWHDAATAARFGDYEALEQLRVGPFHRTIAAAHPGVASHVEACAAELLTRRDCFVHGDFSPKNVLVGADGVMVLDYEVAHFGAAVFDVAFMQSHLALKALHRPEHATRFAAAAQAFQRRYEQGAAGRIAGTPALSRLTAHVACLLLARVDGVSPAPYLRTGTREKVRRLALRLLHDGARDTDLWSQILPEVRRVTGGASDA